MSSHHPSQLRASTPLKQNGYSTKAGAATSKQSNIYNPYNLNANDLARLCSLLSRPVNPAKPTDLLCKWLNRDGMSCLAEYDVHDGAAGALLDHLAYEHGAKLGDRRHGTVECKWGVMRPEGLGPCNLKISMAGLAEHLRAHGEIDFKLCQAVASCLVCGKAYSNKSGTEHVPECLAKHKVPLHALVAFAHSRGVTIGVPRVDQAPAAPLTATGQAFMELLRDAGAKGRPSSA